MTTFTTKDAAKMVRRELGQRVRQLELAVIENESGTIQLEATTDDLMTKLLEHLEDKKLLELQTA